MRQGATGLLDAAGSCSSVTLYEHKAIILYLTLEPNLGGDCFVLMG